MWNDFCKNNRSILHVDMCPRGRAFTVGTCLSLKPTSFAREEYGRVVTTGSEEANGIGQITALPPLPSQWGVAEAMPSVLFCRWPFGR